MRKWLGLGAVIVVVVLWYSYFSSSRAEQTEREEAREVEAASPPPPMAATPAQPAVPPVAVTPKPPASPAAAAPEPGDPLPDRNVLFANRFEHETRDALWANDQEPALKQQLSEIELHDESVSEVECRRTVCRVTFKHPRVNEAQAINLYSRLLTTFGDVQLAMHDQGSGQPAHFYALRKGYTLDDK